MPRGTRDSKITHVNIWGDQWELLLVNVVLALKQTIGQKWINVMPP